MKLHLVRVGLVVMDSRLVFFVGGLMMFMCVIRC